LPLFALSFIPMAINLIYTAFLFSTKRTGTADMIAISRGIVVKALAIFSIPMLFGVNAIWIAPFIAEIITLILAIWLSKTTKLVYQ
jgi:MATE efflux